MIERNELQDAAQKAFPRDQLTPERDRSWELIAQMGWLMIRLPEDAGGLGLDRDSSTLLHFELGRVLSGAPLLPALLTIEAIGRSSSLADKEDWIERTCAGEFVTLNLSEGTVERGADGTLSGTLPAVPDADMASHVLVCIRGYASLVPLDAAGVTVTERPVWDLSRRLFDVSFDGCRPDASLLIAEGDAAHNLAVTLQGELLLGLAADCLGGANATLDMTVEYLQTRKQFERPLAMFQALKHRCADLKTRIGAAEALLWARSGDAGMTAVDLGALKSFAADVYEFVTEEAIQLHGGIGLTEEHQCHLFMKRAMLNLALGGMPDEWYEAAGREALADIAAA